MIASPTLPRASRVGLPAEYARHSVENARLAALEAGREWAIEAIGSDDSLHDWASRRPDGRSFSGRGRVHSVPAPRPGPDGRERWAVRHYRRGGAMASHLGDRYLRLGQPRPFRELRASATVRLRGLRTPAVIVAATYPAGLYYRGDIVTEVVPQPTTLARALHETDGTSDWLTAASSAGRLVDELASAGIYHVDLNAHNILFEEGDLERTWVIDLDRVRIRSRRWSGARDRMLARLTRSVVKVGTPTGERLGDREVLAALGGSL